MQLPPPTCLLSPKRSLKRVCVVAFTMIMIIIINTLTSFDLNAVNGCVEKKMMACLCAGEQCSAASMEAISDDALFRDKLKHMGKCRSQC